MKDIKNEREREVSLVLWLVPHVAAVGWNQGPLVFWDSCWGAGTQILSCLPRWLAGRCMPVLLAPKRSILKYMHIQLKLWQIVLSIYSIHQIIFKCEIHFNWKFRLQRKKEKEIFFLLFHSSNILSGQSWSGVNPGASSRYEKQSLEEQKFKFIVSNLSDLFLSTQNHKDFSSMFFSRNYAVFLYLNLWFIFFREKKLLICKVEWWRITEEGRERERHLPAKWPQWLGLCLAKAGSPWNHVWVSCVGSRNPGTLVLFCCLPHVLWASGIGSWTCILPWDWASHSALNLLGSVCPHQMLYPLKEPLSFILRGPNLKEI